MPFKVTIPKTEDVIVINGNSDRIENTDIYIGSEEWYFCVKNTNDIYWKINNNKTLRIYRDKHKKHIWTVNSNILVKPILHINIGDDFNLNSLNTIRMYFKEDVIINQTPN